MDKNTFVVEKPCPICLQKTHVIKPKSRLMMESRDADTCVHYKDFNINLYRVWLCEHCGFAGDEKTFGVRITDRTRTQIKEWLDGHPIDHEFVDENDAPRAITSLERALDCLDLLKAPIAKKASTNHQLAWVYRSIGDKEHEEEYLKKAAELYAQSLATERYPIGNLTDTMALFVTGSIYYLLNDYNNCASFLSRIIGDQYARTRERVLFEKARDLWEDVRAAQKEEEKAKK
ncbi:MAG: DUF2225 domain-containing protein [Selenomonadaceae bacterium]|nr:DUF2225 domain-containing protein [Selenomonadaceae bacterium]